MDPIEPMDMDGLESDGSFNVDVGDYVWRLMDGLPNLDLCEYDFGPSNIPATTGRSTAPTTTGNASVGGASSAGVLAVWVGACVFLFFFSYFLSFFFLRALLIRNLRNFSGNALNPELRNQENWERSLKSFMFTEWVASCI